MPKEIQTFTGVGKTATYLGDHLYAYSGTISVNNVETDLLEYQTGNTYAYCKWEGGYADQVTADDYGWYLYLNGLLVANVYQGSNTSALALPREIILPPNTLIKLTAKNNSDSTSNTVYGLMTGRVY